PIIFMRMRTATNSSISSIARSASKGRPCSRFGLAILPSMSSSILLASLFAVLGSLLGGLAVAGADFALEHLASRIKCAHFSQAGDHAEPLPHAFLSQLAHQSPHLI